jgi:hypothetical protein
MSDQMGMITSYITNDVIDDFTNDDRQTGDSTSSRASAVAPFKSLLPLDSILPQASAASIVSA